MSGRTDARAHLRALRARSPELQAEYERQKAMNDIHFHADDESVVWGDIAVTEQTARTVWFAQVRTQDAAERLARILNTLTHETQAPLLRNEGDEPYA